MINLTLLGQAISFVIFLAFVMKFVWPPLIGAIDARQLKIQEGLEAAARARADLAKAQEDASSSAVEARTQASKIIDAAQKTANEMIEQAKIDAQKERERIIEAAQDAAAQATTKAQETLRQEVVTFASLMASKILQKEVNQAEHDALLEQLSEELTGLSGSRS